ncbi:MAG: hypothetical protein ACK4UN_00515 [Limisphaerales bacterium]
MKPSITITPGDGSPATFAWAWSVIAAPAWLRWFFDREAIPSGKHGHHLALLLGLEGVEQLGHLLGNMEFPSLRVLHAFFPFALKKQI